MTERTHYIPNGAYHYTESGLDNVWLLDGVEHHETPYGPATSIRDIDELHRAIGISITKSERMTGAEFRFLRTELDL
jgi:putative transcriptional regulator